MSTLYELNNQLLELLMMAEDPDVEEDVLKDTMEAVEGEIEVKADGYAKVIRQLEADKAGIKAEKDRLDKRAKAIDGNISRMKAALQVSMELCEKPKFKTELFSFNIQNNPVSCVVDDSVDINQIPEEYLKITKTINKTALKEAIQNGQEFDYAHLEQSRSLRIK